METPVISHTGAQVAAQEKKDADRELVKNVGHDETKLVTTDNERE
jgi:phosphohistidine phosphatase SixA